MDNSEIFPRHYEAWKRCITEKCRVPLTKEFVQERIKNLNDTSSQERINFEKKYGAHWTKTIISYFQQAQAEL